MSPPASPNGPDSDHRNRLIDGMRGASALAVMLYHFNVGSNWVELPYWHEIAAFGYLGVAVFFVLSGFCIGQSWLKSPGARSFLRRRFWRIYPAYAASIAFIALCAVVRRHLGGVNDVARLPAGPRSLLATITLCTAPASTVPTMNWVYWSLTYEMFFYIVLGALLWVPTASGRRQALVGVHVAFCILALTGAPLSGTPLFFVDNWNLFALGVGACLLSVRAREAPWFLAISAAALAAKAGLGRFAPYDWTGVASVALLLLPHKHFAPGARHALVFLGRISYSIYLFHVPVGLFVFMRLVRPWIVGSRLRFALMQGIGMVFVIAFAALSYRFLEKPFLRRRPQPDCAPV